MSESDNFSDNFYYNRFIYYINNDLDEYDEYDNDEY